MNAYNSLWQAWEVSPHNVFWINQGLYFDSGKYLQFYTLYSLFSILNHWRSPVLKGWQLLQAAPHFWSVYIIQSFLHLSPSELMRFILETLNESSVSYKWSSILKSLDYSCKEHFYHSIPSTEGKEDYLLNIQISIYIYILLLLLLKSFNLPISALATNSEMPFTYNAPRVVSLWFRIQIMLFPWLILLRLIDVICIPWANTTWKPEQPKHAQGHETYNLVIKKF